MATKLYLHDAATTVGGTLPSGPQVQSPHWSVSGATTLKTMNTTIGTGQTSKSGASTATTLFQFGLLGMWVSPPLVAGSTTSDLTSTINFAAAEDNLSMDFCEDTRLDIYIWRPSTGAIVGTGVTSVSTYTGDVEPLSANSERVVRCSRTGTPGVINYADGDVLVVEVWSRHAQASAAVYNGTIYYDGTTENTTANAVVTNHAAYFEVSWNLTFQTASSSTGNASFTLGALTSSSDADVFVAGALDKSLATIGLSAAATHPVLGECSFTLAAMTVVSDATPPPAEFSASITFDATAVSSDGDVSLAGAGALSLGDLSVSATGAVSLAVALTKTLDDLTTVSDVDVPVVGGGSFTLGAVTLSADGNVRDNIFGEAAFTLDSTAVSSTGAATVAGAGAFTMGDMTVVATASITLGEKVATIEFTLEAMTTSIDVDSFVVGECSFTLGGMTVRASDHVGVMRGLYAFTDGFGEDLHDRIHNFLLFYTSGTDATWTNYDLWKEFLAERGYSDGTVRECLKAFLMTYLSVEGSWTLYDLWGEIREAYAE